MIPSIISHHHIQTSVKYPFNSTLVLSSVRPVRRGSSIVLVSASTIIIIFTIVITATVQSEQGNQFSQVITVGPVWTTDAWECTSDADFTVDAVLIAYGNGTNRLTIFVSTQGTQPDFELTSLEMESFTVGGPADTTIQITRLGTISGFITLQTTSGATASCIPF